MKLVLMNGLGGPTITPGWPLKSSGLARSARVLCSLVAGVLEVPVGCLLVLVSTAVIKPEQKQPGEEGFYQFTVPHHTLLKEVSTKAEAGAVEDRYILSALNILLSLAYCNVKNCQPRGWHCPK